MEKKIPVRSEADPKYTWALEDVYANNDLWKADLEKARALPAQLAAYKGHLGDSAQKLLEFLQLGDGISVLFDSLYGYAQRRSDEDTANSLYQGMTSQAMSAMVAVDAASSFETPLAHRALAQPRTRRSIKSPPITSVRPGICPHHLRHLHRYSASSSSDAFWFFKTNSTFLLASAT